MAISSFDYLLKLFFSRVAIGSDEHMNTFFWKAANAAATAQDMWDAFEDKILPPLKDVISSAWQFTRAEVFNLGDSSDFYGTDVLGGNGTRDAISSSDYQCWAFRLNRSLSDRRNGRKAIGVPADEDIRNGVASSELGNDILTKLGALETALSTDIFVGGGLSGYTLCIPHSVEVIDIEHPDGHYVLDNLDPASGAEYVRVSTQNSRKNF